MYLLCSKKHQNMHQESIGNIDLVRREVFVCQHHNIQPLVHIFHYYYLIVKCFTFEKDSILILVLLF